MAKDFLKVLQEIRGTGEPEAVYTDGLYHDLTIKTTDDDLSPRLGAGVYGSIQTMYAGLAELRSIYPELEILGAMSAALQSLYNDKITLDSLYADKLTLDSLYTDKLILDSLYTDKSTLDSLYADKLILDSLFADKATLDSIFTDKAAIDSLYADKVTLDSLYADKTTLDVLYTNINNINAVGTSIADVNTVADNITDVTYFADVYQGPKAVEPTLRNDGSALQVGDLYLDTAPLNPEDYAMKAYNGVDWSTTNANAYSRAESDALHRSVPMKVIAAEPLVKGDLVKWAGYNQGQDAIEVVKTVSQTDICIGVVDEVMATNDKGDIVVRGIMELLDTSAYPEETILYSNGSGGWTDTVPLVSYQAMAYVVKSHASTGAIMINVADGTIRQNLGYTATATNGTVTSPDGTDATIPAATITEAGLLVAADKVELDSVNRLDRRIARAEITSMVYDAGTNSDKLGTITYTDSYSEVFSYDASNRLQYIDHQVSAANQAYTTLAYNVTSEKLESVTFTNSARV